MPQLCNEDASRRPPPITAACGKGEEQLLVCRWLRHKARTFQQRQQLLCHHAMGSATAKDNSSMFQQKKSCQRAHYAIRCNLSQIAPQHPKVKSCANTKQAGLLCLLPFACTQNRASLSPQALLWDG